MKTDILDRAESRKRPTQKSTLEKTVLLARGRLKNARKLFADRGWEYLPHNERGILRWYADHAWVGYPNDPEAAARRLCSKLAPYLSESDLDVLVDETVDSNKRWSHDQSAMVLRLGVRDSRRLNLWFLGCDDDANYEIRIGLRKAKDAAKKRKRRAERSSGRPGGRPRLDLSPEQMAARIKAQNAERARRCRASRKTPSPHKIEETGTGTVFSVTTMSSGAPQAPPAPTRPIVVQIDGVEGHIIDQAGNEFTTQPPYQRRPPPKTWMDAAFEGYHGGRS